MSEIANASINSFGNSPKADIVPPSEDAVFILNSSQLKDLIKEGLQPLQDEVSQLKATVAALEEKITALESMQDIQADNSLIQLRLINDLREATKKDAQPLQRDRGEILQALLAANGGKMLAKDARQKMHLSKNRFSELLATLKGEIEIKSHRLDKRQLVLIIK